MRHVLVIEDNPGDVLLLREAFHQADAAIRLDAVVDGVEAMAFLRQSKPYGQAPRPDLILLDLNMPRMNGLEVLAQLKADNRFCTIPTVILTTSDSQDDIGMSYALNASCYLKKPLKLDEFDDLIGSLVELWLTKASLPGAAGHTT